MRRSPCHQSWAEQLNAPITRSARFIPSSPPPTPQSSPSSPMLPWYLTAPASPYLGETQPPSQPPPETRSSEASEESAGESAAGGTLTAESESTAEPATPFEPEPESASDEPQPIIDLTGEDESADVDVDLSTLAEQARSLADEAGAEVLDQQEEEEQERMLQREEQWRDEDQQNAQVAAWVAERERQTRFDDLDVLDDTQ